MSSNSAFIRGEGTCSALRRVTAEARVCFSCTKPFPHRGQGGEETWTSSRSVLGLSLPLVTKIDHLADVVLHVGRALRHHCKVVLGIGAGGCVSGRPILGRVRADG